VGSETSELSAIVPNRAPTSLIGDMLRSLSHKSRHAKLWLARSLELGPIFGSDLLAAPHAAYSAFAVVGDIGEPIVAIKPQASPTMLFPTTPLPVKSRCQKQPTRISIPRLSIQTSSPTWTMILSLWLTRPLSGKKRCRSRRR